VTKPTTRRIEVGALTRVEGEGALRVDVDGDQVTRVNLAIYEPPRFFEALLVGRPLEDVPDITARICGICPVAYQNTSIFALEQALGISVSPEIHHLRRLLYCAEWIESHGVHMHLLNIPDFFDCHSSIELAKQFPDEVNRGLRLKKHGNELLEVLGGRAVHPINVAVGGFYRAPRREELLRLVEDFRWGLEASIEVTRWVARFDFPDFTQPYEMVALRHPHEYPMNQGNVASTAGLDIAPTDYESHFEERQVEHSTALHSVRLPSGNSYFVGPLARINLNRDLLSPTARQLSDDVGITWPCFNPYQSIVARAIEVVHAYEEALQLIDDYREPEVSRVAYEPRAGEGMAATEAPRGLIYHRYQTDEQGRIVFAKIVPPTSQNQGQIELDLQALLPELLHHEDPVIKMECEKLIRSYDPCISCSTHFLKLELTRR
jgi:coenzyme F420-reducing hydrogenase alpha subunit